MTEQGNVLAGRHALVTGGGQGIGAAIALELAGLGASLTIIGRTSATLEQHAETIRAVHGLQAVAIQCDVTDDESVRNAFARARRELGPIAMLVNNAGEAPSASFRETTRAMWDRTIAVNLTGVFLCTSQVLGDMVENGWGRIVNIASTAGLRGYSRTAAYCAAKHGVVGLTRALSMETAKLGITVNAVCPGYAATRIVDDAVHNISEGMGKTPDEAREMLLRTIPRRRFTTPEEIAGLVSWLCTPAAAAITGAAIPVAGGGSHVNSRAYSSTATHTTSLATDATDDGRASLRIWLRLLTCTNLIERRVRTGLREEFRTTLPRFDVLAQLDAAEHDTGDGLTMSELSRRLMVTNGNLTSLIERLAKERLVTRSVSPTDGRTQIVRLAKQGKRFLDEMVPVHRRWVEEMFASVSAKDRGTLYELLGELRDSARSATEESQ